MHVYMCTIVYINIINDFSLALHGVAFVIFREDPTDPARSPHSNQQCGADASRSSAPRVAVPHAGIAVHRSKWWDPQQGQPVTDFDLWIVDEMCAPGHLVTDNPRKLLRNHKKQWERIVLFHRVVGILHVLWHTLHLYRLEEQRRETSVWPSVESGCAEHASNSQRVAAHTDDTLDRPPAAGLLPHLQVLEISDHDQHDQ